MLEAVLAKTAADIVVKYVKDKITAAKANGTIHATWNPDKHEPLINGSLERHLRDAHAWTTRMQFYGMSRGEETDATTIGLRLRSEPRRFRNAAGGSALRREESLLGDDRNYLLLGDPGAGKTTTLKRLVNRMLTSDHGDDFDIYQFPLVIRLRDLTQPSLIDEIAVCLGIRIEDFRPENADWWPAKQRWLGGVKFEDAISEMLNYVRAVLVLDGLDELSSAARSVVQRDLEHLARNTVSSKIIVSCRSGDYTGLIEGLDLLEICPLSSDQILEVAQAWLPEPASFRQQLQQVPYQDIADRPLLLTQLLYIYKWHGYMPEQPNQIYRKVVALLLDEWDRERGIERRSRYGAFVPERKAAFLAALAYHLTFRVRQKTFSVRDLQHSYAVLHEQFGLPAEESKLVAAELETHSGIIVAAGGFNYEFSHLSLQEYLCADYLVREPFAEHMAEYMAYYPAPVAVAVSLAAEPSTWFAALFLQRPLRHPADTLHSFLSRIIIERPFFSFSVPLGVAVLKLYDDVGFAAFETHALLDRFAEAPPIFASVAAALRYCVSTAENFGNDTLIRLKVMKVLDRRRGFSTPATVALSRALLSKLVESGDERARNIQALSTS